MERGLLTDELLERVYGLLTDELLERVYRLLTDELLERNTRGRQGGARAAALTDRPLDSTSL